MSSSPRTSPPLDQTLARLRRRLATRQRVEIADPAARRAAVLVPLVQTETDLKLLFFLRTIEVWEHKGEICFPGGSVEPGDGGSVRAALREANEELGISPEDVEVVGLLDDVETHVSGYIITPVVGYLRALPQLRPDPLEVERPLLVDLDYLRQPAIERTETTAIAGVTRLRYSYPYDGMRIWGATGRILHTFLRLLDEREGSEHSIA